MITPESFNRKTFSESFSETFSERVKNSYTGYAEVT
jgi:hypothetical protein